MDNQEDFRYLDLILEGNVSAYKWIVDKYKDDSFRLAVHMLKNTEDAEDVVQEGFVKVFRLLKKFNRKSSFSTWLYKIIYNQCVDRIRKRKVNLVNIKKASEVESIVTNRLDEEDRVKYLSQVMNELSDEESTIINLHYQHGKDMREIGVITNTSHAAIRKRISRTRDKIRQKLEAKLGPEINDLL